MNTKVLEDRRLAPFAAKNYKLLAQQLHAYRPVSKGI
jgi:hypothetical protein